MQRLVVVLVSLSFLSACSDEGDDGANTGGTAGSSASGGSAGSSAGGGNGGAGALGGNGGTGALGGSGGTSGSGAAGSGGSAGSGAAGSSAGTAGGSGAPVRGAVSLNIVGGSGCSLDPQYQDFPEVSSGHPVTATSKGDAATDGEDTPDGQPAQIVCEWLGTTAPHTISARITLGPPGPTDRSIFLGSPTVVGVPENDGIGINVPDLPEQYGSFSEPCTVTPIEVDEATRSVWGEFSCPSIGPEEGDDSCEVGPSYFFFENCTP